MKIRQNAITRAVAAYRSIDYYARTAISSSASLLAGVVFLLYNGVLGFMYGAVWNVSICIYYMILLSVKMYILFSAGNAVKHPHKRTPAYRRKVFHVSFIILMLLDFTLIAPIMDMALGHRDYTFGLIPAIAMAAYTTYRIAAAIIHYHKSGKANNLFLLEVRTINIIDALVAVLTLQNALIVANGGFEGGIRQLAFATSIAILLLIIGITVITYRKGRRLCAVNAE